MANKKLFIGIAAGAAALTAVGLLLARQRSQRRYDEQIEEAKENFKSKLQDLQRKAKKQYKNSPQETKDAIANATARAGRSSNA